jgi:hypothetical protein
MVACGSPSTQTERMRDGIYKVDFGSGKPDGKGIAMFSDGKFTGIDRTHIYIGHIDGDGEQLSGFVDKSNYPKTGMQTAVTYRDAKLKLNGKQNEKGEFELSGESERSGGPLKFIGERVADL